MESHGKAMDFHSFFMLCNIVTMKIVPHGKVIKLVSFRYATVKIENMKI